MVWDSLTLLYDKVYRVQGCGTDPGWSQIFITRVTCLDHAYTQGSWSPALTMASTCIQGSWSPALTMVSTSSKGHGLPVPWLFVYCLGHGGWPWSWVLVTYPRSCSVPYTILLSMRWVMVQDPEHVDHGKIPIPFSLYAGPLIGGSVFFVLFCCLPQILPQTMIIFRWSVSTTTPIWHKGTLT